MAAFPPREVRRRVRSANHKEGSLFVDVVTDLARDVVEGEVDFIIATTGPSTMRSAALSDRIVAREREAMTMDFLAERAADISLRAAPPLNLGSQKSISD